MMINLRDRRQGALDDMHTEDYGEGSSDYNMDNMAINMESFYSSFKRRQLEEEKRRESIRKMIKLLYLLGSFIIIMSFSVFMNNEKLRMAAEPMLNRYKPGVVAKSSDDGPKHATKETEERYVTLKRIIEPLSGKAALERVNTPQYKALAWLSNEDTSYPLDNTNNIIQRYSLVTLYFATNGHLWTNKYNFLSDASECTWNVHGDMGDIVGVGGCDPDGNIKVISLRNNNLVGHIPREVALLKSLRVLSLYDNKLRGLVTGALTQLKALSKFLFVDIGLCLHLF